MGTEGVYPVGTVLTRKEKLGDENDVLSVVGSGKILVVSPKEEFGANRELDMNEARSQYEADIPEGAELVMQPPVARQGLSPEEQFAADARKPGATTKRVRKGTKVDDKATVQPPK